MLVRTIVVIAALAVATPFPSRGAAIDAGTYVAQRVDVAVAGRTCEIGPPLAPAFVLVMTPSGVNLPDGSVAMLRDDAGSVFALAPSREGATGSLQMSDLARERTDASAGSASLVATGPRVVIDVSYRRALPDCHVRGRIELERSLDAEAGDRASRIAAAFALVDRRRTLAGQGAWREALEPAMEARDAFTAALDAEHPLTLASMNALAELHRQLDELAIARRLNDETIASLTRVVGSEAFATLHTRQNQALVRWYQGEVDDAERELRDVLQHYAKLLDPDDVEAISTLANLGALLVQRGRLVEAERIMFDVLARLERTLGPDDERTLVTLNNLAVLLDSGGRLDESLQMYAALVQRYERTGGRAHPNALYALMNQADTLGRLGRFGEAIPIAREVQQGLRASLGSTHTDALLAQHNLAWLLAESGHLDEAWILQRALVTLRDRVDGANSREALKARNVLGLLEVRRGDVETGLRRMATALETARKTLGEQDPTTLEIAARVAASQREAARLPEARRTLRELVAQIEDWRDSGAMTADTRRAFLAPWVTSYKSLAALDLAAGDVRAAFDQAERSKARVLVELLSRRRGESAGILPPEALAELAAIDRKLVDAETRVAQAADSSARVPLEVARIAIADEGRRLRSSLRERYPKYASLSQASIVDVDEAARALPQRALFVSYLRDGERVLAFTLDDGGRLAGRDLGAFPGLDDAMVAYRTLLVGPQDGVPTTVWRLMDGRYKVALARPAGAQRVTHAAQIGSVLFDRLVAPLPGVRNAKRLIVSPDGALAILPFEALPFRGRPLVASYEVSMRALAHRPRAHRGASQRIRSTRGPPAVVRNGRRALCAARRGFPATGATREPHRSA